MKNSIQRFTKTLIKAVYEREVEIDKEPDETTAPAGKSHLVEYDDATYHCKAHKS